MVYYPCVGDKITLTTNNKQITIDRIDAIGNLFGFEVGTNLYWSDVQPLRDTVEITEFWEFVCSNDGYRGVWYMIKDGLMYIRSGRDGDDNLIIRTVDKSLQALFDYEISNRDMSGVGVYKRPFQDLDWLLDRATIIDET